MKPIHQHLREFWWQDRSMVALLVGLVVVIFIIYPMGGLGHTYGWLLQVCISVILIAGVGRWPGRGPPPGWSRGSPWPGWYPAGWSSCGPARSGC